MYALCGCCEGVCVREVGGGCEVIETEEVGTLVVGVDGSEEAAEVDLAASAASASASQFSSEARAGCTKGEARARVRAEDSATLLGLKRPASGNCGCGTAKGRAVAEEVAETEVEPAGGGTEVSAVARPASEGVSVVEELGVRAEVGVPASVCEVEGRRAEAETAEEGSGRTVERRSAEEIAEIPEGTAGGARTGAREMREVAGTEPREKAEGSRAGCEGSEVRGSRVGWKGTRLGQTLLR